jgi:hypothetical protein
MDRSLDKKIGKLVYGFTYTNEDEHGDVTVIYKGRMFPLPFYSSNMSDTERAISAIQDVGLFISMDYERNGKRTAKINDGYNSFEATHRNASTAICLAIENSLMPKSGEWDGEQSSTMVKFGILKQVA